MPSKKEIFSNRTIGGIFLIVLAGVISACQSGSPSKGLSISSGGDPVTVITSLAKMAQKCWLSSRDTAFREFRISSEANSYAGRPRFLLVRRKDPNGLPHLVVQAEKRGDATSGTYTNIQTFGPLLQTRHGKRIADDVSHWSKGNTDCRKS